MNRIVLAAVLPTVLSFYAGACSFTVPLPVRTGQSFRVLVTDRDRPVAGLRLLLSVDAFEVRPLFFEVTNALGIAQFNGVPEGIYYVLPTHGLEVSPSVAVEVTKSGPKSVILSFHWPSPTPIRVRTAAGVLHDLTGHTLSSISLVDALSGQGLQTTHVNESGGFAFQTPKVGLYFVILELLSASGGVFLGDGIAIEVNKAASKEKLDLDLRWSDCGVHYVDRNEQRK